MRNLTLAVFALSASCLCLAEPSEFSKEQARLASLPNGGVFTRPLKGKLIAIRNKQKTFSVAEINEAIEQLHLATLLPAYVVDDGDKRPVGAEIFLSDEPKIPDMTILAAPEQGKVWMATAWLTGGTCDAERRKRRLYIELLRAVGMAYGAGAALYPCVMTHVHSLRDLDRIKMNEYGPETSGSMMTAGRKLGIRKLEYVTYREACQEGWAASPTNDEQKVIWDEVRAIPEKPLKIEFDPATQKGKVTK